jgi:shikimate kinase
MGGAGEPLWLVGMMGSGKTTVAPLVAAAIGREWVDADDLVVSRSGQSIDALFALSESVFRDVEVETLRSLAGTPVVVAAGGGAVTGAGRDVMAESGVVVWLRTSLEELRRRLADDDTRPLLRESSRALEQLFDQRAPLYESCADHVIDTEGSDPEQVAAMVVAAWRGSAE